MPWCALLTAVKNYNKSLEKLQDFFFETKTKTFIFVVGEPRDQDRGLEDYITGIRIDCSISLCVVNDLDMYLVSRSLVWSH